VVPPVSDDHKNPIEQAVDLFFFAPLGLVMNANEIIPQLAEKGRQQAKLARMFGRYTVNKGQTRAANAVKGLQQQFAGARVMAPAPVTPAAAPRPVANSRPKVVPNGPSASSLAIPDYDSLSASQVVPRLDGLAEEELDAVRRYEAANRGRQTILNKIAQLQD
jgi:hypothetical protein